MARTPDRRPGRLVEEEILLDNQTAEPVDERSVRYVDGGFFARDSHGIFDIRGEVIENGNFSQLTYNGSNQITDYRIWDGPAQTNLLRHFIISYTGGLITQIERRLYDGAGNLQTTVIDVITYNGNLIDTITRTRAP